VFDFPLMWAIREAVAHESAPMASIEATLRDVETKTAGSGATMARMIGNHDTTRFLSEAAGGTAADPWASPEPQPAEALPYERQALAIGLVLTLPGLPVIYYGDEVGLAGGQDPDCRRVMPRWDELSGSQETLLQTTRRLGRLRRCSPALRTGARTAVITEDDVYAFVRAPAEGPAALVIASRAGEARSVAVPGLALKTGDYVDALSGEAVALSAAGTEVTMAPRSLRVLLPADDPCLADP
jgi:glycosidase